MRLRGHTTFCDYLKGLILASAVLCACSMPSANARDPTGQWAYLSTDMKEWFKSLHSGHRGTPCCDDADGEHVADVDWDTHKDGGGEIHYRVFLQGAWRDVPNEAVITEPNKFGPAVVWPVYAKGGLWPEGIFFHPLLLARRGYLASCRLHRRQLPAG